MTSDVHAEYKYLYLRAAQAAATAAAQVPGGYEPVYILCKLRGALFWH